MFELYNFDADFQAYTDRFLEQNAHKFKTYEKLEDEMPKLYIRWLNSPAAFLNGEKPGEFFEKYDSAPELIKWLRLYIDAEIPVPDLLADRISALGEASVKPLIYTAKNENNLAELRMMALDLLKEVDEKDESMPLCLSLIDACSENDEDNTFLAEKAQELFEFFSDKCVDEIFDRLHEVNKDAREFYLDILVERFRDRPEKDERVFEALINEFESRHDVTGMYATMLGRYGDDRALPYLIKALDREDINYMDYVNITDAIGELGGETEHERDFSGDEYYEALKNLK